MWQYWLLLMIPMVFSLVVGARMAAKSDLAISPESGNVGNFLPLALYAFLLVLLIGWRHEVGGDWLNYLWPLEAALDRSLAEGMTIGGDPAYGLLTWISARVGGGIYLVNLVCAIIFVAGLLVFASHSPQPWLALCVAVPYLVIVVAMGYTRQGVAIGLTMVGLVALDRGRLLAFAGWLGLAALFHKSAVILVPLAVFSGRNSWRAVLGVLIVAALLFMLLLAEYVDFLTLGYLTAQYESSGAAIRVAMNALPAFIFLSMRKRFVLPTAQKSFWTWMSLGALLFIVLLAVSPSSTAVDRVALYWVPLQLFVWSRLPQAMGRQVGTQLQWLVIVLVYAVAVQYVWLFHADNSAAWIPYKFYPWEATWQ